jgi:hypothetical protein
LKTDPSAAPYPYLVLDALEVKWREGGRTVNACVVHAVAVNREGYRESLGLDVVTSEDGAAWLAFLRSLLARGLAGVKLVTSDAHPGLVDAIAATLAGSSWQRCRTHFMRNLLARVPKSARRASSPRWCARSSPSPTPTRSASSTAASSSSSRVSGAACPAPASTGGCASARRSAWLRPGRLWPEYWGSQDSRDSGAYMSRTYLWPSGLPKSSATAHRPARR